MQDYNEVLEGIKAGVADLANKNLSEFRQEATNDGIQFIKDLEEDMKGWFLQLAKGEISQKDLDFLMKSKASLAKMNALKLKGLGQIKIEKFRNSVIDLAMGKILGGLKL